MALAGPFPIPKSVSRLLGRLKGRLLRTKPGKRLFKLAVAEEAGRIARQAGKSGVPKAGLLKRSRREMSLYKRLKGIDDSEFSARMAEKHRVQALAVRHAIRKLGKK